MSTELMVGVLHVHVVKMGGYGIMVYRIMV